MRELDMIQARVTDCATYNFGMRNADKLAHEDAPSLLAAARAIIGLHAPVIEDGTPVGCSMCDWDVDGGDWPCKTVAAISAAIGTAHD